MWDRKLGMWFVVALGLTSVTACGGGDDDGEPSSTWQCYTIEFDSSCECYEIEPGSSFEYEGDGVVEVNACEGYEVCMSYFDTFFEERRCDCGGADFMPFGNPEDFEGLAMEDACPAE